MRRHDCGRDALTDQHSEPTQVLERSFVGYVLLLITSEVASLAIWSRDLAAVTLTWLRHLLEAGTPERRGSRYGSATCDPRK
jgi:hypothetical protein